MPTSSYQIDSDKYENIVSQLGTDPVIVPLFDSFGILFACAKIAVPPEITKAIENYADVVPASEAGLDGYCDTGYRIKLEFRQYFPSDDYDKFGE